MKMLILMVIMPAVAGASVVIAMIKDDATDFEQALEDEEQAVYLEEWHRKRKEKKKMFLLTLIEALLPALAVVAFLTSFSKTSTQADRIMSAVLSVMYFALMILCLRVAG